MLLLLDRCSHLTFCPPSGAWVVRRREEDGRAGIYAVHLNRSLELLECVREREKEIKKRAMEGVEEEEGGNKKKPKLK